MILRHTVWRKWGARTLATFPGQITGSTPEQPPPSIPSPTPATTKTKPTRRSRNRAKSKLPFVLNVAKKDARGQCSRELIRQREIAEALALYNRKNNVNIDMDQVTNSMELITAYAYSSSAPQTVISGVHIVYMTSEGEGIGIVSKTQYHNHQQDFTQLYSVVVVPKTVPGDIVTVSLRRHFANYVEGIVESVDTQSPARNDSLVECDKFSECAGCQLQMLSYEDQLEYKRKVMKRAYSFFYPEADPGVLGPVFGSPLQYSYRTKLTPHSTSMDAIGFNNVHAWKGTVDIDKCAIAVPVINQAFERTRARTEPENNTKGATLCFRRSFDINVDTGMALEACQESPKGWVTEVINNTVFQFRNHHFFQNNASILPLVLDYVKDQLEASTTPEKRFKYLIDTYCGSGFFGICLANSDAISADGKVYGIEIAAEPVEYARRNARLNGLQDRVHFIAGDAHEMFTNPDFVAADVKGDDSVVIMDPSRKGSDEAFLKQIQAFQPRLVVYISCNVFTQARDLAMFREMAPNYRLKSVVGFDFFPQTKHVESIAVLERT